MPEDLLIVFESPCLLLWLQLLSKYCKTFRGKKERDRFSGIPIKFVIGKANPAPISVHILYTAQYRINDLGPQFWTHFCFQLCMGV